MRWLRLDLAWDDSPWLFVLSPGSQLGWIKLLCHVKRDGAGGKCKALADTVAAKKWGIGAEDVQKLLQAGVNDGAIIVSDGEWTIVNWAKFQESDTTAADRMRRYRAKKTGEDSDGELRSVTRNQGVTRRVTETVTETETETERRDSDLPLPPQAKGFSPPTVDECRVKAEIIGMPPDEGEKFWNHYTAQGWLTSAGMPVTSWQALIGKWRTNWLKEKGKAEPSGSGVGGLKPARQVAVP